MMTMSEFTPGDKKRYDKWLNHLQQRQVSIPTKEDFLSFGGSARLRKLLPMLSVRAPNSIGPIRLAISESQAAANAKRGSKAKGGLRGPARQYSVARDELPLPLQQTIKKLLLLLKHKRAGGINFDDDLDAMPESSIHDAEYILRAISRSCQNRGEEPSLTTQSITFWLDDAEQRGCGPRGLSCQIGILKRFVLHHEGIESPLAKTLGKLRGEYIERGKLTAKRKESDDLKDIDDLGAIWLEAEAIFRTAQQAPCGTYRRFKLFLDAAAIAISVVVPLRISDLHRFEIGSSLTRNTSGWSLRIKIQKTSGNYMRDELWPELTPFLDALITEDAPGGDLWAGYSLRKGTRLFSRDGGKTGLSGDWISDVWFEHFGCGAHFVRTLWHENIYDEDDYNEWIALSLCGQKSERTAKEYRRRATERRRQTKGRRKLVSFRNRLANIDIGG
nr:hypothetical protein [uncultured Cohaesibacter sp.]